MRIFVLEDDLWRQKTLTEHYLSSADEITMINSCREGYQFNPPYDLILLDHDLGGRQLEQHEDCGLTFVRQMKRYFEAYQDAGAVVIHSYNFDGAKAMAAELEGLPNIHVAPFGGPEFNRLMGDIRFEWEKRKYGSKKMPKPSPASPVFIDENGNFATTTNSTANRILGR